MNSSQEPLITKSKRSYLKVAQQGPADSRGGKGGGTGRAQQAWPLPESSKGASGKRRDTRVGLSILSIPVPSPWVPLLSIPQGLYITPKEEKHSWYCKFDQEPINIGL